MTNGITSFLRQSQLQSQRTESLRTSFYDLQRQLSTGKKFDTFSGLEAEVSRIQRQRADVSKMDNFVNQIEKLETRIEVTSSALTQITETARTVIGSIRTQTTEGDVVIAEINDMATNSLSFIKDLINTEINGRYLFAGSAVSTKPLPDLETLNTNLGNELDDWLDGTNDSDQLLGNINGIANDDLGYANALASSGDVFARIDTDKEINYTVKGDNAGFQELLRGIGLLANISQPDQAVDVATDEEFHEILNEAVNLIYSGIEALDGDNYDLSNKASLINDVKERHISEQNIFLDAVIKTEEADLSEVVVSMQQIQTQLTASYESTSIIRQLSLVNFL